MCKYILLTFVHTSSTTDSLSYENNTQIHDLASSLLCELLREMASTSHRTSLSKYVKAKALEFVNTWVPLALESMINSGMTSYVLGLPLESLSDKFKVDKILRSSSNGNDSPLLKKVKPHSDIRVSPQLTSNNTQARKMLNMEVTSVVVTPPRVLDMIEHEQELQQQPRRHVVPTRRTTKSSSSITPADVLRELRKLVHENERRGAVIGRLDTRYVELSNKLYKIVRCVVVCRSFYYNLYEHERKQLYRYEKIRIEKV